MARLWLIPLDYAVPAVEAFLVGRPPDHPLSPEEARAAAVLLERCVQTGEALVTFALHLGGPPIPN
jgi:hypothetical protein